MSQITHSLFEVIQVPHLYDKWFSYNLDTIQKLNQSTNGTFYHLNTVIQIPLVIMFGKLTKTGKFFGGQGGSVITALMHLNA